MAIRIAEVKSSSLSDDKKEVIVGGSGKYIGDVELRFARECLDDLMYALARAKDAFEPAANSPSVPSATAAPAPDRNGGAEPIRTRSDLKSRRTSPCRLTPVAGVWSAS